MTLYPYSNMTSEKQSFVLSFARILLMVSAAVFVYALVNVSVLFLGAEMQDFGPTFTFTTETYILPTLMSFMWEFGISVGFLILSLLCGALVAYKKEQKEEYERVSLAA